MKKLFAIAMVALFATAMVSCGKDNDNGGSGSGGGGNTEITDLNGTMWRYDQGNIGDDGYIGVALSFISNSLASITITTYHNQSADGVPYGGPWTYANGQGSIELTNKITNEPAGTANFLVRGTELSLQMPGGGAYTLHKVD